MKRGGGQSRQENDEEQRRGRARRLTPAETAYESEMARLQMREREFGNATARLRQRARDGITVHGRVSDLTDNDFKVWNDQYVGAYTAAENAEREWNIARTDLARHASDLGRRTFIENYNRSNPVDLTKDDEDVVDLTMDEGSGSGTSGVPAVGGFTPYANAQLIPLANRIG